MRVWRILFHLANRRLELMKTIEEEMIFKVLTVSNMSIMGTPRGERQQREVINYNFNNFFPQMPLAFIDAYSLAYAAQLYEEMPSLKEEALALANKLNVCSITKEVDECIRVVEDGKGIALVPWIFF